MGLGSVALGVCVCLVLVTAQNLNILEEKICKETNGTQWLCKKLSECPRAQEDQKVRGISPQICNPEGKGQSAIVCCQPGMIPTPSTSKINEMCRKYAKEVSAYTCGPDDNDRLDFFYGGRAKPREFPHTALIGYGNESSIEYLCGGSLISDRFVLSAAHCSRLTGRRLAKWVRLGDYKLQTTDDEKEGLAGTMVYGIEVIFNHPEFRLPSVYNDIALYKLNTSVQFSEFIRPICLQIEHKLPHKYVTVAGWERHDSTERQDDMGKMNLTLIDQEVCNEAYKSYIGPRLKDGIKDESMICTLNGHRDCVGESGGPLQQRLMDPYCMYSQVGVASLTGRCVFSTPEVFTRVFYYIPWIESIVWP